MAYRDAIPTPPAPELENLLGARIAGVSAILVVVLLYLPMEWTYSHDVVWLYVALRLGIGGGALLLGLRTKDRLTRIAAFIACAGAFVTALCTVWTFLVPYTPEWDQSRPYWAVAKMKTRLVDPIRVIAWYGGLAALAWAGTVRGRRVLAYLATAFAAGGLYKYFTQLFEYPWIQHYAPDPHVRELVPVIMRAFENALPLLVGIALVARPRTVEEEAPPPYREIDRVAGAVNTLAVMIGTLGMANQALMFQRGERQWDNWMVATGSVHLEWFEPMMAAFHGGVIAAAVHLARIDRRLRIPAGLVAFTSTFLFMRGRLHVPISTAFDWETVQFVWALLVGLVGILAIYVARKTAEDVHLRALGLADDVSGNVVTLVRQFRQRAVLVIALAMVSIMALAIAESARAADVHEGMSYVAALTGVAAMVGSIWMFDAIRRRRVHLDEAIRRELNKRESPSPASH